MERTNMPPEAEQFSLPSLKSIGHMARAPGAMFADYPDIVSVEDLMQMLSIGRNTAYSLLQDGSIISFRIGECYKITKQSVIDFAQGSQAIDKDYYNFYHNSTSDGLLVNDKEG